MEVSDCKKQRLFVRQLAPGPQQSECSALVLQAIATGSTVPSGK